MIGSIDEKLYVLHDDCDISLPIADFLHSGSAATWQKWIDADPPLPARFVATCFRELDDVECMATFLNWNLKIVSESDLVLEIPARWDLLELSSGEQ